MDRNCTTVGYGVTRRILNSKSVDLVLFFKEFSGEENKDGIARGGQRSKKLCFVIRKNRGCLHSVGKKPE